MLPDRSTLTLSKVSKAYRKTHALTEVSLTLSGPVSFILGRNGAGKSTLVRLCVGYEDPTSGSINSDRWAHGSREYRRNVGWLPQSFGFPRRMKVYDFISYAAWLKEVSATRRARRVEDSLDLTGLTEVSQRRLDQLSGGTLRRVGIAAAIVHQPRHLFLDEPTAGLDPEQREQLHRVIRAVASTGVLITVSSHLLEDVAALADEVFVLNRGHLVWQGGLLQLAGAQVIGKPSVEDLRSGFIQIIGRESDAA